MNKNSVQSTDELQKTGDKEVSQEEITEEELKDQQANTEYDSEEQPAETTEDIQEEDFEKKAQENGDDESETEEEVDPITELQNKLKEQEDKYVRTLAELENFKRRTQQETRNKLKFAGQNLALDIIPGLDNLERAIGHAQEEEGNEQLAEFVKGIEMVQQAFYDALSKNKIERDYPEKKAFDPNHHEAVSVVETDDVEPEHIVRVFQAGYIMHDRVIRPAMVQVAKKK